MEFLPSMIHFFAAMILLISFSMLVQRRMMGLIRLLSLQGFVLSINTAMVAYFMDHKELYLIVLLTLGIKVGLIPFVLYRILIKLNIRSKIENLVNTPTTLLIGLSLVIFAFYLSFPIQSISHSAVPTMLALSLASVLISSFMMIIKRKAISQVVSLLSLENCLFFVASSSPYSMPLIVELGIAFDVLVALFIFGVFFFKINESFESFDLSHLEKLRED